MLESMAFALIFLRSRSYTLQVTGSSQELALKSCHCIEQCTLSRRAMLPSPNSLLNSWSILLEMLQQGS